MKKEMLKNLTNQELLVYAAEANSKPYSKNDRELVDMITDELKERNKKQEIRNFN